MRIVSVWGETKESSHSAVMLLLTFFLVLGSQHLLICLDVMFVFIQFGIVDLKSGHVFMSVWEDSYPFSL